MKIRGGESGAERFYIMRTREKRLTRESLRRVRVITSGMLGVAWACQWDIRSVWGGADMSGSARWIVIGYCWPCTSENTLPCCLASTYLRI